jgi:hypothetical protein
MTCVYAAEPFCGHASLLHPARKVTYCTQGMGPTGLPVVAGTSLPDSYTRHQRARFIHFHRSVCKLDTNHGCNFASTCF